MANLGRGVNLERGGSLGLREGFINFQSRGSL